MDYKQIEAKWQKKWAESAVYVREPGSTEISEQIRRVILDTANTAMTDMTEALLYAASRAQLVREVIKFKKFVGFLLQSVLRAVGAPGILGA